MKWNKAFDFTKRIKKPTLDADITENNQKKEYFLLILYFLKLSLRSEKKGSQIT